MKGTITSILAVGALALVACGSATASASPHPAGARPESSAVKLTEAGSTLEYPYLETIAGPFHAANAGITLSPGPGGSGEGLTDAAEGLVDFGGSDAYLSTTSMAEYPSLLNIPLVVSSQAVNYNLKGIKNLKLTGAVLAAMYEGQITKWNAKLIRQLNPGVKLPNETIHPIHRSDSSGDSFLFSSLLTATSPSWKKDVGASELPNWPRVAAESTAEGNPGMAQACKSTPGCVAYIGISEEKAALGMGLGEARLRNKAGNYEQSNSTTVDSAVNNSDNSIPKNLAASLIYAPGTDSYPIVNFEYALVKKHQSSSSTASALRTLFDWIVSTTGGSKTTYLSANQFQALPTSVLPRVKAAISSIS